MLPQVNYLTALEVYLWACFFFVCVTLVEYIYLNYITIVRPKYQAMELSNCGSSENNEETCPLVSEIKENIDSDISGNNSTESSTESSMENSTVKSREALIAPLVVKMMKTWRPSRDKKRLTIKIIDGRFRSVYYSGFVLFNIWYWIYYFVRAAHNIH